MRTLLTVATSLFINLAALAAFAWVAHNAEQAPPGQVTVTELAVADTQPPADTDLTLYAQARNGALL